ncbi:MAG: 7-cyano-7-deazaguanine synthase [Brevundimonas sp.]|uniref:7-cyano-7-deazaguanine synthase n=1 Tax=Brevundimonas sp. TaxID=1871086 RepID=UPI00255E425E|nr:7-cyano-7-deazaguanine synthase [Brevundimonas sp.]
MKQVVLLSSGGLDSSTIAYSLVERSVKFVPLFFDYGQHCVEKEWDTLNAVLPPNSSNPVRLDISGIFSGSTSRLISEPDLWTDHVDDRDLYVPYRTLFFFSAAAAYAQTHGMSDVYAGFINSNHAKELDCTEAFFNGLDALSAEVGPVRFHLPIRQWSKSDVVKEAIRLGVPIGRTYSCQLLSDTPCGACPNCVERLTAIDLCRQSV